MNKRTVVIALVLMGILCSSSLLGRADLFKNGERVESTDWPTVLTELVNLPCRVFCLRGGPAPGNAFCYYSGNVESFDRFIVRCSAIQSANVMLTIYPGRGKFGVSGGDKSRDFTVAYDWKMHVPLRLTIGESRPPENSKWPVDLDLYLGDKIRLAELKVPMSVEVKAGGVSGKVADDIRKYAAEQEAQRKKSQEKS